MKLPRLIPLLFLLVALSAGTVQAAYLSDQDVTLSVTAAPSLVQTSGWTGESSFALQESAYGALTGATGQEVDHYYVWIYVNGEPVLAADPLLVDYD